MAKTTMKYKQLKGNKIEGELDIFIARNEDENDGEKNITHFYFVGQ